MFLLFITLLFFIFHSFLISFFYILFQFILLFKQFVKIDIFDGFQNRHYKFRHRVIRFLIFVYPIFSILEIIAIMLDFSIAKFLPFPCINLLHYLSLLIFCYEIFNKENTRNFAIFCFCICYMAQIFKRYRFRFMGVKTHKNSLYILVFDLFVSYLHFLLNSCIIFHVFLRFIKRLE